MNRAESESDKDDNLQQNNKKITMYCIESFLARHLSYFTTLVKRSS